MSVLLGIKDAAVSKTAQTFPTLNKIGGEPDHFLKSSAPLLCPQCEKMMPLVVQLYCPLDHSSYHRTLYIYTCVNRLCWGKNSSWKVLREQKLDESFTSTASTSMAVDSQKDVWGAADDDWGDDNENDGQASLDVEKMKDIEEVTTMINEDFTLDTAEQESSLSSSEAEEDMSPVQKTPESVPISEVDGVYGEDAAMSQESLSRMLKLMASEHTGVEQPNLQNTHLNSYYLNVFEDCDREAPTRHVNELLESYSKKEGKTFQNILTSVKSGQGISGDTEDYERDDIKYKDAGFYKFHKMVSSWPEQCVRYNLGGTALPLTSEQFQPGKCMHCGSDRQFELQLMPALVSALTFPDSQDYAVEFGTILIFTCKHSCWEKETQTPRSEHCIIQCEKEQFLLH